MQSSPIRTYFDQGLKGENALWAWLAGFWFAVVFWMFAQNIIAIPMFGAMMIMDSAAVMTFLEGMMADQGQAGPLASLMGSLTLLLPLVAIILFALRNQFDEGGTGKKIAMYVAAGSAIISTIGLIHTMINTPPGTSELIGTFIAKSPVVYALMLMTFIPLIIGLWLTLKFVHGRAFKTLLTAHKRFRWGRLAFSMIVFWIVVGILTFVIHTTGYQTVDFVFDPKRFWTYAVISLLFIPLQSAAEELMLRGYMNQGLGKYISNPWIVFFITSALFASLHLGNPEAAKGAEDGTLLITMSGYFFFGFFACVLTYIDGGLESAIGVHAANNLFASIVLGYENSALPTPTLFKTTVSGPTDALFTILALGTVCAVLWVKRAPLEPTVQAVE